MILSAQAPSKRELLVSTIPERCRVCYTCVRECPAKAIRIHGGQAEVIEQRCIGCGNCVRVCSQSAKQLRSSLDEVDALLRDGNVSAVLAPSFAAEIGDLPFQQLVGALRAIGFNYVNEVAFGADLVAAQYRRQLGGDQDGHIATTCPALVAYVTKYHPDLTTKLAPIVSPMIAIARVLHQIHGPDLRIVFIGPCIAKKQELLDPSVQNEVNAALTFHEMWELLRRHSTDPQAAVPSDFDEPQAGLGQLFPLSRGLLQVADLQENLLSTDVVAADGCHDFVAALKEFAAGTLDAQLLEVLCCNGCIRGAGMSTQEPLFRRRARVSRYARERAKALPIEEQRARLKSFEHLDLSRTYLAEDQRIPAPSHKEILQILGRLGKHSEKDELNCGACGYETCRDHAIAIHKGLAESAMCLPNTIEQLNAAVGELDMKHTELVATQQALMQSERLASMGQLAAGVAHEINNPLGVVLLYSHALLDECSAESELRDDLSMVVEQADRCKKIVSGLLNFARRNKVARQKTCVPRLVERCLTALAVPTSVKVRSEHSIPDLCAHLDPDQIVQVLTNLISNAIDAMTDGGLVTIRTSTEADKLKLTVEDTGHGIEQSNIGKIFDPFFTTKQIGKGTGLGLAVTYGIIKMHGGSVEVQSNTDPSQGPTGTRFCVRLPMQAADEPYCAILENENE